MRGRRIPELTGILLIVLALTNCSAPGSTTPAPTTTDGSELFSARALGASPGCVTCHSLTPDYVLVGPSLAGVAERADDRVAGMNADEYLERSIVAPLDYIVDTFDGPKMPDNYDEILSAEQIDSIVTYLLETT